jgi:hypothetical protein
MHILALVRGARDRDLGVTGPETIRSKAQERQRLEWLHATPERRLRLRRTG